MVNSTIFNIAETFRIHFPPGCKYLTYEEVQDKIKSLAKSLDFVVSTYGIFCCNQAGTTCNWDRNHEVDHKRRSTNILKCGCEFAILVRYTIPTFTDTNNSFGSCVRYAMDRNRSELQEVRYKHSNACQPSCQLSAMKQQTSGTLFE